MPNWIDFFEVYAEQLPTQQSRLEKLEAQNLSPKKNGQVETDRYRWEISAPNRNLLISAELTQNGNALESIGVVYQPTPAAWISQPFHSLPYSDDASQAVTKFLQRYFYDGFIIRRFKALEETYKTQFLDNNKKILAPATIHGRIIDMLCVKGVFAKLTYIPISGILAEKAK